MAGTLTGTVNIANVATTILGPGEYKQILLWNPTGTEIRLNMVNSTTAVTTSNGFPMRSNTGFILTDKTLTNNLTGIHGSAGNVGIILNYET